MIRLISTINILFITTVIFGQLPRRPFEEINLQGLSKKWQDVIYENEYVSDTSDGYNFCLNNYITPIIKDSFIYALFKTRANSDLTSGTYIEKRNLLTGQKIWANWFDTNTQPRQENIREFRLNADGNLDLIGVKRYLPLYIGEPYDFGVSSKNTRLMYRIIDSETGAVLHHYDPDLDDESLDVIQMIVKPVPHNYTLLHKEDNNYRYIKNVNFPADSSHIISYLLNSLGQRVGEVDTFFQDNRNYSANFRKIGDKKYLYIDDNYDKQDVEFIYFDEKLNVLDRFHAQPPGPNFGLKFIDFKNDKALVFQKTGKDVGFGYDQYNICVYDRAGDLLQKVRLPYTDSTDYFDNFHVLEWAESEQIVILATNFKVDYDKHVTAPLQILVSNNSVEFDVVQEYYPEDTLRGNIPIHSRKIDDNNYIVWFKEFSWYNNNGFNSADGFYHAISMMNLSADDLGFKITSNIDQVVYNTFGIYPNPTNSTTTISLPQIINKGEIQVFDQLGKFILKQEIQNESNISVNVADFPSGVFIINVIDYEHNTFWSPNKLVVFKQ